MISCPRPSLLYSLALIFAVLLALSINGCSIKLISDYDEVTDRSVTELQKKIEAFLIKTESQAGTKAGEYAQNKAFYDEIKVDLGSLKLRAEAIPQNEITAQHIRLLENSVEDLRRLHEIRGKAGLPPVLGYPIETAINTQIKAILTLELAKKRGK